MAVVNVVPVPLRTVIKTGSFTLPEGSIMPYVTKKIDKNILGEETYILEVTGQGVTVGASTDCGLFRGWQTIKQLVNTAEGGELPCMKIEDRPRFAFRGFMIDSARHMQTLDELKTMIDAAALFKFNVFHWHLSDDQGFRMEIEKYPRLMEVGSVRASSDFGNRHVNEPYGGYYTKEDMREVVRYCAQRYIDVIPEMDMPGHTTAMLASYPALSCSGEELPLRTTGGIFPEILCAGKDETFAFIEGVLDEVMEVFPSRYIHIGGDEAPKTNWRKCPACQARMVEEGLRDEEELQGYFANRVQDYLRAHGRTAVCWNESLKSGMLENDMIAQMWMDKEGLSADWANSGGKVIVSDFFHYYTDYPYAMTSLSKTYSYEPVVKGIEPAAEENVLGVSACIWTEYVETLEKMAYMTFPRFAAVAETGWSYAALKDRPDFLQRMRALVPLLKKMGVTPAPVAEWNPHPAKKAKNMVAFFTENINGDMVRAFIRSKKEV
ncbi:MAG: beta-N-acetylhexosaminidase [Oscillospiraceae bacterium]|nr:beta-N-acetylhexosaminidase [Oscillospiraceae bacterium]